MQLANPAHAGLTSLLHQREGLSLGVDDLASDLPVTIHNARLRRRSVRRLMVVLLHQTLSLMITMPRLLSGLCCSFVSFFQGCRNVARRGGDGGGALAFFRRRLTLGRTLHVDRHWV